MITYVYVVKCPNCEDEFFDFFDEAKDFATGCLSKKPIITQTEVNRNDFGECTDSADLGTIWSWEDMMKDVETEPADTVFSKAETFGISEGLDDFDDFDIGPQIDEFETFNNSLDFDFDEDEVTEEPTESCVRKTIPEGMTIEQLQEEMEENEDTVECSKCGNLVEKANCHHNQEGFGWCCNTCEPKEVHDLGNTYDGGYPEAEFDLDFPEV